MHGLEGVEGIERLGCDGQHCEIQFYPLQSFVKARMAQLLSDFASPEKARVRQGGSPPDRGITLVPDAMVSGPGPRPAPFSPARVLADRYGVVHTGLTWTPGRAQLSPQGFHVAHDIFGSERMIDIWDLSARAYDLGTGMEVPRDAIVIREVRRSSDTKAFRISVELPASRHGHWLTFTDPRGQRFASSLAGADEWERPVYELTIDFELDAQAAVDSSTRSVSTVEARLSRLSGSGLLGRVAEIWDAYETQNVDIALRELDVGDLREIVMEKLASSLAATVAAVLLLRARRLDRLPASWLANLSNWFPENPDAAVLRVERERLTAGETQDAGLLEQVGRLAERGLPRLAELLPVAWRQLAELTGQHPETPWLPALHEQLHTAMRYHRPGGLFAIYASPTDPLDAGLVSPRGEIPAPPG